MIITRHKESTGPIDTICHPVLAAISDPSRHLAVAKRASKSECWVDHRSDALDLGHCHFCCTHRALVVGLVLGLVEGMAHCYV
jgi:hypothetical protein